jgi:hypothetical protein
VGVDPYAFTSSAITGSLTNWGSVVQSIDTATTNTTNLPTATNASPGTTTLSISKKFYNTIDKGSITFTCSLTTIEKWNFTGKALITFPTYYAANIGEGIYC